MIKNRIKTILQDKGMTQADLAQKLRVLPETLSRTINGNPTLKSLTDIANALEVEVSDLFSSNHPKGFVEYDGKLHRITSTNDLKELLTMIGNKAK